MFGNLGMSELIIIAGIALVVIGPEKFPEFAKIAMRAYRDLRGYVDDIKREMAEEVKPVQRELRELARYNPEDYIENIAKAMTAVGESDEPKKEETASTAAAPQDADSATPHGETTSQEPSKPADVSEQTKEEPPERLAG